MNIQRIMPAFVVTAFCLLSAGAPSSAHAAGFRITIDCHGNADLPNWAHTPNNIELGVTISGFYTHIATFTVPADKCDGEDELVFTYPAFSLNEVSRIYLETDGTNVFWIDLIKIRDNDSGLTHTWGVDNNIGYCMSMDSGDGNNSYCYQNWGYNWLNFILPD